MCILAKLTNLAHLSLFLTLFSNLFIFDTYFVIIYFFMYIHLSFISSFHLFILDLSLLKSDYKMGVHFDAY